MIFYHVSPFSVQPGTRLKLNKGRICLATTPEQAIYWSVALAESRPEFSTWYIYAVEVPDEIIVEDCQGHYHFETPGQKKLAKEVMPHTDPDGEVVLYEEVASIKELLATVTSKELGKIGQKIDEAVIWQERDPLPILRLAWLKIRLNHLGCRR